jgi:DNA invertase Pin-like site-specific DNA recombinase
MKAATYSRYSSANQRESSIADQQRNCHARAKAEGWVVIEDFSDRAFSGTDNRRPGYRAMQGAAIKREFDVLVVDDLSRLTRDVVEQETVIRRLEFQGIRIVSCADGYDSQSAARKIHRGMKGLMNSVFLDDLADKVHRGQKGQALTGCWAAVWLYVGGSPRSKCAAAPWP